MNIDPNDPKLTAYALGELDEKERAEIEAQLKQSAELRRAVDEIRETAELLTKELASEPGPKLSDHQRRAIEARAAGAYGQRKKLAHAKRLTLRRWWLPTPLAASLLIVAGVGYALLLSSLDATSWLPWQVGRIITDRRFEQGWQRVPRRCSACLEMAKAMLAYEKGVFSQTPAGDYSLSVSDHESSLAGCAGFNTEAYDHMVENPFLLVRQNPLSTFSIDVDTASYANIRHFLNQGRLPPPGAVRIEEMVNYFDYDYPLPTGNDPFSVNVEVADCPWSGDHLLARIGIKGQEFTPNERPPANLVFLIDVSGSMRPPNKLPLLKQAMRMLVDELTYDDYVAIAVDGRVRELVLPPTSCENKGAILAALDHLQARGSTNSGAGIQLAYDTAADSFIKGGVNRVILATDGDFNVGVTNQGELIRMIEEKAKSGVFLSVLGFGMGNYKDSTLEKLADKGNGNYAHIDTLSEAQKVLVDQMGGTLVTIAKDVKIQIEFNPAEVNAYRLIGYENRLLRAEDFNDDTKDAGEIGAGHTVTAFYEIVPAGVQIDLPDVDPPKYQRPALDARSGGDDESEPGAQATGVDSRGLKPAAASGELMTVKLRYKQPDGDTSKLIEVPVTDDGLRLADASEDFVFAASVASFGMLLRGSKHGGDSTYKAVLEMARRSLGEDPHGYREQFVNLVERAGMVRVRDRIGGPTFHVAESPI